MSSHSHSDVEFKTTDGLTIRGWLYPAERFGPGIILTPGFNCVKEMFIPDAAAWFRQSGITALIYDPRSIGLSDGQPRNDIDPLKQAEDYHDALTFLAAQSMVDPSRIVYWGFSFSGAIALAAAAFDKRAAAVISVCPMTSFDLSPATRSQVLELAIRDRESRLSGNEPLYIPMIAEDGTNPAGFGIGSEKEDFDRILKAKALAPSFDINTTIQTYYRVASWQPFGLMPHVSPTPVMIVTAENDQVSLSENQRKLFGQFEEPKAFELVPNKGHMDCLSGEEFPSIMQKQVEFLKAHISI